MSWVCGRAALPASPASRVTASRPEMLPPSGGFSKAAQGLIAVQPRFAIDANYLDTRHRQGLRPHRSSFG